MHVRNENQGEYTKIHTVKKKQSNNQGLKVKFLLDVHAVEAMFNLESLFGAYMVCGKELADHTIF